MDSKLASFLKDMRSMDYADEKPTKNPPPNGITAAEIEAISTKTYATSEQEGASKGSEAPPPPAQGATYWQALVDPNTNLTYYWNSATNDVSWTLPEGGVITLPMATEQVEAKEKELEMAMESYPYSTTIAAEFIKPATTTTTTTAANGAASLVSTIGKKRPKSSPGKPLEQEAQPSLKKSRLNNDDSNSSNNASMLEDKPSTAQTLPEEKMKIQVNNMVALLSKKLQSLQPLAPNSSQLETLSIQLQTRQTDWNEGGVSTKYMLEKLRKMNEDIFMFESSLLSGDQGFSTSDNEPTLETPEAVTSELSTETRVASLLEVQQLPGPQEEEGTLSVDPQLSQYREREGGAVSQSTGEVECSGSSSALHSNAPFPKDSPEEDTTDGPGPPSEVLGPSLPAVSGALSEAKVEPETGMHEGEPAHYEDERVGGASEEAGHYWHERAGGWQKREEGHDEEEPRELATHKRVESYGVEDTADRDKDSVSHSMERMNYERIVEDVSDKDDDDDVDYKLGTQVQPQAVRDEEGVSSEEEGVWVEPGKERSEGELLDDSSDSSGDEHTSSEDRSKDSKEKFGPLEESSSKKNVKDSYEKSEGELDQDSSEDEKSEGELDDDKEEVWEERTDYRADRGSHSHRRQNYRPQTTHDQDSDLSDYTSSRRDRREQRHYDSDYSDEYYSSRNTRHHHREHKNYNRHSRDRYRDESGHSRDKYRDESDYSDEYSRRRERGRYGDGYEQDYYKSSRYGSKSSRSSKTYGESGSSSRYQHSRRAYDSDNEREHDRHRRHSSGKHRKRDREKDKDRKKKQDHWGSSQNKDSEGEEKKPAASVLIGKVGKIGTVRLLGKEKKAEEGADSTKPGENAAPSSTSMPSGAVGAPPPLPPAAEMPAYQQMSATYYQHPSTGEVPYYTSYGAAYQYPAYSTAQTYQQPPPPAQPVEEQEEEPQKQQAEEGWIWITSADGTPQWVKADTATTTTTATTTATTTSQQEEGDKSLKSQQKDWGEANPAQWGGTDPIQWASMHTMSPPPLPLEEPKPDEPKPEEPKLLETEMSEEAVVNGDGMCSKESLESGAREQHQEGQVVVAEGQPVQASTSETTDQALTEGAASDLQGSNQLHSAGSATGVNSDTLHSVPVGEASTQGGTDDEQKAGTEIADCEMEIESNHGSPIASEENAAPMPNAISGGDASGPTDMGQLTEAPVASTLPVSTNDQQAAQDQTTVSVTPSSSTELVTTSSMEVAQGDVTTHVSVVGAPPTAAVPPPTAVVESSSEPSSQQSSDPSVSSSEAVTSQAAMATSSSAVYYASTAAPVAAAPPPPVDAASYSYAAAYGQPAYNYAYAQGYNYAYMQQPAAYGAYGVQAGAPAYYQGMYPAPGTAVYGTYPQTYYAATSYSSVPPPTFQPSMSTVTTATSGVDTTQLAKSATKDKSSKSMMEQWAAFKEGKGKS